MISIFDFKSKEPEKIPAFQYAILFVLSNIVFGATLKLTFFYLGIDQDAGLKTTPLCAMFVAYIFVYKYRRLMTKPERQKVTWYAIFLTYGIVTVFLYSLHYDDIKIGIGPLIAIAAMFTAVMYYLMYLAFGWFSKVILKQIEQAEEKQKSKP